LPEEYDALLWRYLNMAAGSLVNVAAEDTAQGTGEITGEDTESSPDKRS
jgi:hypothetical protein